MAQRSEQKLSKPSHLDLTQSLPLYLFQRNPLRTGLQFRQPLTIVLRRHHDPGFLSGQPRMNTRHVVYYALAGGSLPVTPYTPGRNVIAVLSYANDKCMPGRPRFLPEGWLKKEGSWS